MLDEVFYCLAIALFTSATLLPFKQLIHLVYFTLIRTANSPRLLYSRYSSSFFTSTTLLSFEQLIHLGYLTLVFDGEVTSLGGELVITFIISNWQYVMDLYKFIVMGIGDHGSNNN